MIPTTWIIRLSLRSLINIFNVELFFFFFFLVIEYNCLLAYKYQDNNQFIHIYMLISYLFSKCRM